MMTLTKRNVFYALFTILAIFITIRYGFSIDVPRMLITFIVIFIVLIGGNNEILAISMCCIPLHNAINVYISIFFCSVILIIKNIKNIRVGPPVLLGFGILIWELLHCLQYNVSLKILISSVIPIIFVIVLICCKYDSINYEFILRTMAIMTVVICFVCLLSYITKANFNFAVAINNMKRLGMISEDEVLFGGAINPNSMGVINVLSISSLLQLIVIKRHKKIDYLIVILLILSGFLTLSRVFLICLVVMSTMLIIAIQGNILKKIRYLLLFLLLFLIVFMLLRNVFPEAIGNFIERFNVNDVSNGRVKLFKDYNNFIFNNLWVLFFGIGISDFGDKVISLYSISTNVPHNGLQEIILIWGIPGLAFVVLFFKFIISEAKKYNKNIILLNCIPIVIILTKSITGQFITSAYTVIALGFIYMSFSENLTCYKNK